MSKENVERLRESMERFVSTGEPLWSVIDEDVVIVDHDILDAGEYRGWDGFMRWIQDFSAAWADFTLAPEEYLDAGNRAIVFFRIKATGAGSGVTVERQDAMVCEMRDVKAVRIDYYNSREQALKAVALEK
jgi:ketosteroid isomerase-like protein